MRRRSLVCMMTECIPFIKAKESVMPESTARMRLRSRSKAGCGWPVNISQSALEISLPSTLHIRTSTICISIVRGCVVYCSVSQCGTSECGYSTVDAACADLSAWANSCRSIEFIWIIECFLASIRIEVMHLGAGCILVRIGCFVFESFDKNVERGREERAKYWSNPIDPAYLRNGSNRE